MQKTTFFAPLRKIEDVDDGSIMVTGIASTESRDSAGEILLASAIKKALPAYKKFPAVREMHGLSAAGRAVEIDIDDAGVTTLTAHIVDPNAVRKVKNKIYSGFSVGGKILKRDKDDRTIITEILLAEISLVDRPSNSEAAITMWKIDAGMTDADSITKATTALDKIDAAVASVAKRDATDVIMKALQAKDTEIDRLEKRIEELLAEPAPPKTAGTFGFIAVSKEEDAGGAGAMGKTAPSEEDLAKALASMSEEDRALLLIKASRQLPRPVTTR
jgi:HK97 family phage prohead protease